MKTDYALEVGSKADLTSKMEMGMDFDRFPTFFGNERSSGMEFGIFEVVSKIFVMKRFSRNEAFSAECRGMG